MQFIVTGRAIDGLPMPAPQALAAYRATFEMLTDGRVPHVTAAWPHADERATTFVVDVDSAEALADSLAALPAFMLSTWEAHPVTTPAHVARSLAQMESALTA